MFGHHPKDKAPNALDIEQITKAWPFLERVYPLVQLFSHLANKDNTQTQLALAMAISAKMGIKSDDPLDLQRDLQSGMQFLTSYFKEEKAAQIVHDVSELKADSTQVYLCSDGTCVFAIKENEKQLFVLADNKKSEVLPSDIEFAVVIKIESIDLEQIKQFGEEAIKNIKDNLLKNPKDFLEKITQLKLIHDQFPELRPWVRQYIEENHDQLLKSLRGDIPLLLKMLPSPEVAQLILEKPQLFGSEDEPFTIRYFIEMFPDKKSALHDCIKKNQDIFFNNLYLVQRVLDNFPESMELRQLAAEYILKNRTKFLSPEEYAESVKGNEEIFFRDIVSIKQILGSYPQSDELKELAAEHMVKNADYFLATPEDADDVRNFFSSLEKIAAGASDSMIVEKWTYIQKHIKSLTEAKPPNLEAVARIKEHILKNGETFLSKERDVDMAVLTFPDAKDRIEKIAEECAQRRMGPG